MRKIITSLLLASAVVSSGAAFARGASNSDSNQGAIAQSEVDFRAQEDPGYLLSATPRNQLQHQRQGAVTQMTPAQAAIAQGLAPINQ